MSVRVKAIKLSQKYVKYEEMFDPVSATLTPKNCILMHSHRA